MSVADNKAVVQRLFDEVWNGRRFDVIDDLYAADFVADYRPYAPLAHADGTFVMQVRTASTGSEHGTVGSASH